MISGSPKPNRICTSHIERQNLTMRMQICRLTRLTNAFSKKYESHKAAIALHFAYYNLCKFHQTLRASLAMEAGITDHVWTIAGPSDKTGAIGTFHGLDLFRVLSLGHFRAADLC